MTAQVAEKHDIWWVQWHCLHDGDEAGGAFAFRMLQPDSEQHVPWDALTAATAGCTNIKVDLVASLYAPAAEMLRCP